MPINFPSNPSINQQSTQNNRIYQWTGSAWEIVGSGISLSASQISDFNSSVSGLLQVKDIVAGTGISISSNNGTYTINSTSSGGGGGVSVTELIYSYASTSGLPASGDDTKLYIITDSNRMYRWIDNTNKYVETGPIGGGDTSLWNLFLPPAPTGVAGVAGNTQVTLSWSAPTVSAQTPITDYTIQYSSNSGTSWTTFSDGISTVASVTVTGLVNGSGYIFRVAGVNAIGNGNYSSNSSTITPGGDSNFNSVALLMHMEGSTNSFTDSSSNNRSITTYGNSTQSTTQFKFGTKSWLSDGNGDYLVFGSGSTLSMGTNDFTIEMWLRLNSYAQASLWESTPIGGAGQRSTGFIWYIVSGGTVYLYHNGSNIMSTSSAIIPLSQWSHVALSRTSGTTRMYVDGVQVATTASSYNDTANGGTIGAFCDGGTFSIDGYIDEVRVTRGVSRYSGSSLTVPTTAFPDF